MQNYELSKLGILQPDFFSTEKSFGEKNYEQSQLQRFSFCRLF